MQKLLVCFLFYLLSAPSLMGAVRGNTSPNSIFQDDLSCFENELADLSALEELAAETKATHSQLVQSGHPLASKIVQGDDISAALFGSSAPEGERLMGIPGFLWGLCCSVFGVLLMYLAIDDPESKKKEGLQAIIGCAIGTLVWVGLYVWLIFSTGLYE